MLYTLNTHVYTVDQLSYHFLEFNKVSVGIKVVQKRVDHLVTEGIVILPCENGGQKQLMTCIGGQRTL